MVQATKQKKYSKFKRPLAVALAVVIILILAFWVWERHSSFSKKASSIIPSTASSSSKSGSGSGQAQPQSQAGSSSAKNSAPAPASTSPDNGPAPQKPYGDFVSTHSPSSADTIVSVCNTTPRASCYIEFTNNGVTKKLSTVTTDGSGGANWTWKLSDAGLTKGDWKITAVSSLNGKIASTSDPLALKVQ